MEKNINTRQKHYNRFKGFLRYDIEEREPQEQQIILEEVIRAATDMLEQLKNK